MGLFDFLRSEKRGDNFLRAIFGGQGAANRTAVNRDTSLTFSAVFACVRVISESIASLPIKVYKVEVFWEGHQNLKGLRRIVRILD